MNGPGSASSSSTAVAVVVELEVLVVEREVDAKFEELERLRREERGGRGSGVGGFENGNQFPLNGLTFMEDIEETEEEEE